METQSSVGTACSEILNKHLREAIVLTQFSAIVSLISTCLGACVSAGSGAGNGFGIGVKGAGMSNGSAGA